jgi:hypothetical protein
MAGQEVGKKPVDMSSSGSPEGAKVGEPQVKKQGARHG